MRQNPRQPQQTNILQEEYIYFTSTQGEKRTIGIHKKFGISDRHDIFDRHIMDIYMNQYEKTYDDIEGIQCRFLSETTLHDLPNKLQELTITTSLLQQIVFNEQQYQRMKKICIIASNITQLPFDISRFEQLEELTIQSSGLEGDLNLQDIPFPLYKINLNFNSLQSSQVSFSEIIRHASFRNEHGLSFSLSLTHNRLARGTIPNQIVRWAPLQNLVGQNTYQFVPITEIPEDRGAIQRRIQAMREREIQIARAQQPVRPRHRRNENDVDDDDNEAKQPDNILNSTQTVHITSINKSVATSFDKIMETFDKIPKEKRLTRNEIKQLLQNRRSWISCITNTNFQLDNDLIDDFNSIINVSTPIGNLKNKTFAELLVIVLSIIMNLPDNERRKDAFDLFQIEMRDAIDMCYVGHINRLVNSMTSIVEGVHVGLSQEEMVQNRANMLVKKIVDEQAARANSEPSKYTYAMVTKDIEDMFADLNVVPRKEKSDISCITQDFANGWIQSLTDLANELKEE